MTLSSEEERLEQLGEIYVRGSNDFDIAMRPAGLSLQVEHLPVWLWYDFVLPRLGVLFYEPWPWVGYYDAPFAHLLK